MGGNTEQAASVLETLLELDSERATAAATHFQDQMKTAGQPFMIKAMGLRNAVTGGTDEEIEQLLADCFGLSGDGARASMAALKQRYR